jgi:hypothetical protein
MKGRNSLNKFLTSRSSGTHFHNQTFLPLRTTLQTIEMESKKSASAGEESTNSAQASLVRGGGDYLSVMRDRLSSLQQQRTTDQEAMDRAEAEIQRLMERDGPASKRRRVPEDVLSKLRESRVEGEVEAQEPPPNPLHVEAVGEEITIPHAGALINMDDVKEFLDHFEVFVRVSFSPFHGSR